jgi:hypothetical protein
MPETGKTDETLCGTPIRHQGYLTMHADRTPITADDRTSPCTLPNDHDVQIEDSDHVDAHGCFAPVLVHQSTIREVGHVAREWPDGIHTCAQLQELEPGRRPCTCGRCPSAQRRRGGTR